MKYLAIALATAALLGAQTPVVSIRPNPAGGAPSVGSRTGVPILGYILSPGSLGVRPIIGTAKGAQLGPALASPRGAKHLYVPPREHYILLESVANEPLSVWSPAKEAVASTGAMVHPDVVAFSARGDAALVYARNPDRLQVISGLPAEPVVASLSGVAKFGDATAFAISDDGAVVVAMFADGTAVTSLRGAAWLRLPAAFNARAILFVPNTYDLVISDSAQQMLTLLPNVGDKPLGTRILAQNVNADLLAFTKEGDLLLAGSPSQSELWIVDLKTLMPRSVSSSVVDTLLPLRDGHTFLLSSPGLSLLSFSIDGDLTAAVVPVTR